MFGQVAQESEGMVFGGSEEAWFIDGLLASSETSEKSLVGGKAGEEVCSMLGKLPGLGFQLEVVGNERAVEEGIQLEMWSWIQAWS